MPKLQSLVAVFAVSLLGSFALAGCGEEVIVDEELTAAIEEQFQQQTGTKLTSIECDEVKAKKGAPISCEARNENDMQLKITGEVTGDDGDGDKWGFDWEVVRSLAPGEPFEESASDTLAGEFGIELESVECPDRIEVRRGNEVKCEATATDGTTRGLTLRLTDAEGGFRVTVDDE